MRPVISDDAVPSRLKLLLPLLGVLALLGPLVSQVGHFVLVAHSRCADHGELVHDSSLAAHAHERGHQGGGTSAAVAIEPVDAHAEHDHCAASALPLHLATIAPLSSSLAELPECVGTPDPGAARVGDARTQLWHLAPKTSPPSRRS